MEFSEMPDDPVPFQAGPFLPLALVATIWFLIQFFFWGFVSGDNPGVDSLNSPIPWRGGIYLWIDLIPAALICFFPKLTRLKTWFFQKLCKAGLRERGRIRKGLRSWNWTSSPPPALFLLGKQGSRWGFLLFSKALFSPQRSFLVIPSY